MRATHARVLVLLAMLTTAGFAPMMMTPPAAAGPEPPSVLATAYNTQRKLVLASDGTLYAAITVNASGTPSVRVFATRDGTSWSPLLPPPTSSSPADRTTLAIDSAGRLHLAWTEVTPTDRQVFYARYEGGAWAGTEQLSHSPGYAGFPSLAVDAQDRVHMAWYAMDGASPTPHYQIYYRRLEPSGWTAERALTFTNVDATNPAIALSRDGDVHIAWARVSTRGNTEIAYLRLSGDNITDGPRQLSGPGVDALAPSLVVNSTGTVHVAWDVAGVIQGRDYASGTWSPIANLTDLRPAYARNPSLSLDFADRLYLFFEVSDGSLASDIYMQVLMGAWTAPGRLTATGTNTNPNARWAQFDSPTCGTGGRIDVVWTEDVGGELRLAYRAIDPVDVPPDCSPSPPRYQYNAGFWGAVAIGLFAVGAAAVVAVSRRRRRGPEAP